MNRLHFSGSWFGRFRVLPPLALVGAHGTEKYRIRSLPSVSFCFSSPRTEPTPSRDRGRPIYADHTIEHRHADGLRYRAHSVESGCRSWNESRLMSRSDRYRERQTRSNCALKAHLVTASSVSADRISAGNASPEARSMTRTSPPSTLYPNSRISKSGLSAYL